MFEIRIDMAMHLRTCRPNPDSVFREQSFFERKREKASRIFETETVRRYFIRHRGKTCGPVARVSNGFMLLFF